MKDERPEDRAEGGGSWLDELSLATRLVFFATIATIGLFFVFVIAEILF